MSMNPMHHLRLGSCHHLQSYLHWHLHSCSHSRSCSRSHLELHSIYKVLQLHGLHTTMSYQSITPAADHSWTPFLLHLTFDGLSEKGALLLKT